MNKLLTALFICCHFFVASGQPLTDGEYFIKINQTGKYIAVAGAATNNGAVLIQWDNEYKAHFKFIVKSLGSNIYSLKAVHSALYISTDGKIPVRGARLLQWDWLNQDNQKWLIQPHKNGKGYVMYSVANGMKVIMQHWNAGTATPQNGSALLLTDDVSTPDMILDFKKNEAPTQAVNQSGSIKTNGMKIKQPVTTAGKLIADIADGIYKIRINESGKYLAIAGQEDMNNGMRLIQWDMLPRNNHLFEVRKEDNGNYTISAVHSKKVLDVVDRNTMDGTQIQQWDYLKGDNQQWKFLVAEKGVKIVSVASGKELQLSSGVTNNQNGTPLIISGNNGQTYTLVPARANKFTEYITLKNVRFTVPHGGDLDMFGTITILVTNKNGNSLNKYYLGNNNLVKIGDALPVDMDKKRVVDIVGSEVRLAVPSDELAGAEIHVIYGINEDDADVSLVTFGSPPWEPGSNPEEVTRFETAPYKAGGADDYYLLRNNFSKCIKSVIYGNPFDNELRFYVADVPPACLVHVNLQDEDGSDNWLDVFFTITRERK
jgi:Ricin-type beta-trefoil lectin domain-like